VNCKNNQVNLVSIVMYVLKKNPFKNTSRKKKVFLELKRAYITKIYIFLYRNIK